MKSIRVYGLTCVLMVLAVASTHATTIVLPTDEQLIAKSPLIVEGTVVSTGVADHGGKLYTETVVSVDRTHKGAASGSTITVREIGGETGDRITKVYGTPEFTAGERVLLFLEPSPRRGYRTMDLFLGKFREERTMNGRRIWFRAEAAEDVTLLDDSFRPVAAQNVQRDAAGFETFVADRVAGRSGLKTYGIENPVLALNAAPVSGPGRVESNFTLISEPKIYRWFRFANGQSASWYSQGTQTGYTGGGANELQTAMSAWNNYGDAKINYSYAGSRSGSMGGLDNPNGVNEVLFNDPLNEISGSYSKSAGGVVGIGGFNGVNAQQTWNAPFNADSSHTAGAKQAWNITEGNLSIQDGVSPANGMSSNRLAEIISHEFGHTLGFGHSGSSGALMYATVTGIGPQLRSDDQVAARWLYPNGSGAPAPSAPAAPGNVAAVGSVATINVTWKDNSTNETAFAIYIRNAAGGAYSQATTAGTNQTSATLHDLAAGSYNVYVVARNGSGDSAQSNVATATVTAAPTTPPVAKFKVTLVSGMTYRFTNESTGTITSQEWSFGDGGKSALVSPSYTYANPGQFTVRLTLNGNAASATQTVHASVLAASFVFSPAQPKINDLITFTDQSTGSPNAWNWSFSDGTTATGPNPAKRFTAAGNYTATLTVTRASGETSTGVRPISVTGSGSPITPAVHAAFDASTSNPATGAEVKFTDRSTGSPTSWNWSFGDGGTSAAQSPVHAFKGPGVYTVRLTASNGTTSSTATKEITVASTLAFRTLVSVAAQTNGVGGTSWRTELNVFNAGSQGANVTFSFIPTAGGATVQRDIFLSPRQSATYANALLDLFNIPSGAGAMAIEASSAGATADLRVTSRTFTSGGTGTYGQAVPDVQRESFARTLYITGIAESDAFRTNVGVVNRSANPVSAALTLYTSSGSVVGSKNVGLAANSFQQSPLSAFFPEIAGSTYDVLTMRVVTTADDALSVYASVVDNRTQDPIYVQAVPSATGGTLTIPVVGRSPGANKTFWRSDVTLFNPTTSSMSLSVRYGAATKPVVLGGTDTLVLRDILSEFGQTSGNGTLVISWNGATGPVATSRTYTSVTTGGTYGQSIDPVASFETGMYVPGLRNDSSYRSNVGFVNGGTETEIVTVRLLSASGTQLGQTTLSLGPNALMQYAVTVLFPNAAVSNFTLQIAGDTNAKVFAYGSMVDNKSGDPVFFAGR